MKYITVVNEEQFVVEIKNDHEVIVNGTVHAIDLKLLDQNGLISLIFNHHSYEAIIELGKETHEILMRGELYSSVVQDEQTYQMNQARGSSGSVTGEITIKSPMPGVILKLPVPEGTAVMKGDTVAILESMKMENELKSTRDGIVKRISVKEGATVEKGQLLLVVGDQEE